MQKILMIGVILLTSCKPPTIKKPVQMYAINTDFQEAGKGFKNLNIRDDHEKVGEWIGEVEFIDLKDAPKNMFCFSTEDWLVKIKPVLKEGAEFYRDFED